MCEKNPDIMGFLFHLPWAWQRVLGRWKEWGELTCWLPRRRPRPGRRSLGTEPPLWGAPTAAHRSWWMTRKQRGEEKVTEKEGKREWRYKKKKKMSSSGAWACYCHTSRRHCLLRTGKTWWPRGPSRSRCLPLTSLWSCATPWPGQSLWSSRSSSRCRHSRSFQVIKLQREATG